MKIIIAAAILILCTSYYAIADIPVELHDLVELYGKSENQNGPVDGWTYIFTKGDMTIRVRAGFPSGILAVEYQRQTAFNELEIADIIKPLSTEEKWKQVDGKNWILPEAKVKAHWDGEGKITVQ